MTDLERDARNNDPGNTIFARSECHPEACGRQPLPGENAYAIKIPLEGGGTLVVSMGQKGYDNLTAMMTQMRRDDVDDATRALDDSLRIAPWTSHSICPLDN